MGDDPQDRAYPWYIPPQGGPLSDGNATKARRGGEVGVLNSGHSDVRGDIRGGGDIHPLMLENYIPVYCDSSDTIAMYGGGNVTGRKGETTVVRAEGYGPVPRKMETCMYDSADMDKDERGGGV